MKRLLATIAIAVALGTTAQAQQLTKVRVAYDGFSMTSGPLIYAEKQGIFKKFGLDIAPMFVEAGSTLTRPWSAARSISRRTATRRRSRPRSQAPISSSSAASPTSCRSSSW